MVEDKVYVSHQPAVQVTYEEIKLPETKPEKTIKKEEVDVFYWLRKYSEEYGVSYDEMYNTMKCESGFQNIQSRIVQNGIQEDSWGVSQINLPHNPTITKAQALDVEFSVKFMAEQFSKGNKRAWTCWRQLYLGEKLVLY